MKQHITPEQLAELSDKGKKALFDWELKINTREANSIGALFVQWREDKNLPLLSIGQMIEFLQNSGRCWWTIRKEEINAFAGEMPDGYEGSYSVYMDEKTTGMTLCDALWQAVKHELSGVGE